MKSTLISVLALAAFVYACFCMYLYLFQRSFIYFPTPATEGAPAGEAWVESGGERLRIWVLHRAQADAIIYFGGNAENVSYSVPEFAEWFPNLAVYLVNYRGYGGSSGSPHEAALYRDAEAVFDFVKERHAAVSLVGRSLGAAVAVHLATQRKIERLALVTPFDSLGSLARDFYPIFPTSLLLKDTFDAAARAGKVRAPALVVVAEHDEIIPRRNADRLSDALGGPHDTLVVPGTGHNTIGLSPDYGRFLQAFLGRREGAAEP